ncbi:PIR protein [Plasmodium yoelii]|uniref:PIR protein n=3 Tax=Plasmodium yoelii TaxID=5861 RepID=A0AAE9WNJ1_PLAYO|nr:PIR protein [Plasmodium yoelii]EAA21616.1 putative yir4 protein [Plasmodium yoelii yoelii]WBY57040.1 PIR protein [Plasmodium yoelii yoelii]CDS44321.1 YIR protein [Plasmodium yoelii]VTZ77944.1 PIR protein [Plasmodium yoelii]|eukprot:XP_022811048.1 PIR protein [Plasmodium yoelii]
MDKKVCKKFQDVEDWFLDELGSDGENQFKHPEDLQKYCITKCNSNLDKINAGCLYLLDQFYKHDGMFPSPSKSNPYIVDNIFIWLSYMLNMDTTINYNGIKYLYDNYITKRGTYKEHINGLIGYNTYEELIDERKGFLNMDKTIVSKFYEALKSLCKLYNELDDGNQNCMNYLNDDNEFSKKYKDLNEDTNITKNSYYSEILSTLSNDYNDFKRECNSILSSLSKETEENHGLTPEQYSEQYSELYSGQEYESNPESSSEVTSSSSSIVSKLIPVLLILGAIPIFFGIAYKYSLFGFRKRVQKHLRKKLKK